MIGYKSVLVNGGGGGTSDYTDLSNKPSIENVTLSGNKSASDLGLAKTTDLADFITKTVDDLVNYYKKTETYTKGEVDTIVTAIKNSRFEVVATLPTSDIKTNVIYLVPKADAESGDIKDEYINLDGTTAGWEKIGSTEVDLSGYVTTTALNTALANYTTTTDLTALLANKQDKVQYSTLPTPSAELEGKIFEYTGATGGELTHGYFYECVSDGKTTPTYSWQQTNVQPSSGGGNTVGSLVVLTCAVDDIIGQSAVVTDEDGETFTGIFENNKKCQIIVPSVGNLTISGQSFLPVTLSVDYYSKYVSPVIYMGEPPTNTSYDSAYGFIESLLENNIVTYDHTLYHLQWYYDAVILRKSNDNSTFADIPNLSESNMTQIGVGTVGNMVLTSSYDRDGFNIQFNKDGYYVISNVKDGNVRNIQGNMAWFVTQGNIFSVYQVQAGDSTYLPVFHPVLPDYRSYGQGAFLSYFPMAD